MCIHRSRGPLGRWGLRPALRQLIGIWKGRGVYVGRARRRVPAGECTPRGSGSGWGRGVEGVAPLRTLWTQLRVGPLCECAERASVQRDTGAPDPDVVSAEPRQPHAHCASCCRSPGTPSIACTCFTPPCLASCWSWLTSLPTSSPSKVSAASRGLGLCLLSIRSGWSRAP